METRIENILVLEEVHDKTFSAAEQSAIIAEKVNANLIIYFCDFGNSCEGSPKISRKGLEKKLEKYNVNCDIKEKVVSETQVLDKIKKDTPSLLLINASCFSRVENSVVRDLLSVITSPLLYMKKGQMIKNLESIILPLDLTTETTDKVNNAVELALLFNSTIHVISFLTDPDDFLTNKLNKQLDMVKDYMLERDVKVTTELIRVIKQKSGMAGAIVSHSDKQESDLLMVMARDSAQGIDKEVVNEEALEIMEMGSQAILCVPPLPSKRISFK